MTIDELKKKRLLTRQETADYLGISLAGLNKVIYSADFPAVVRIGARRVFINRDALDKWIDEKTGK